MDEKRCDCDGIYRHLRTVPGGFVSCRGTYAGEYFKVRNTQILLYILSGKCRTDFCGEEAFLYQVSAIRKAGIRFGRTLDMFTPLPFFEKIGLHILYLGI